MAKKEFISRKNRGLTWRGVGPARMRHGNATWQRHEDPREGLHGADVVRTHCRAMRVHADARVARMWHECIAMADDGPTGIVGPEYSIGAVMHLCYIAPPFICMFSAFFSRVGLIYLLSL